MALTATLAPVAPFGFSMRAAFRAGMAVMLLFASPLARAASSCVNLTADAERLDCYDRENGRLPARPSMVTVPASAYQITDLVDLKTDIATMSGHKVQVDGRVTMFAGVVMLVSADGTDTSPVMVDMTGIPRNQRRAIIERCEKPCPATVRGAVGLVSMNPGIVATSIALTPGE